MLFRLGRQQRHSLFSWHVKRRNYSSAYGVNYILEKIQNVKELDLTGTQLRHKSGATILHLSRDDLNSAFSIGFKTFPKDSTGAPHILEHTVLCGSSKYPVRDPFFKMLNRSLSTYMNAWTACDWTMYPFTTQNSQDFYNLRSVYFDAVFNPLLREQDFRQEGWRLEHTESDDLMIKGVVFNEMKGAHSDNESLFATRQQQTLLQGSIYGNCSGGDPLDIPSLSHKGLINFHSRHYHPSNALFFSYGNLVDLKEHSSFIDDALSKVKRPEFASIGDPMDGFIRSKVKRYVESTCAPDPMGDPNKQVKMLISFLANPVRDAQTTFNMKILGSLLFDGPSSPMHQALIDSNIGKEYAPGTGYSTSTATSTLSVGLQGIGEGDVGMVEQIIDKTLSRVIREGFSMERVEGILHQIELSLRHHSASFGLGLAQKVTADWVYGVCPLQYLQVRERIDIFLRDYKTGGLFESLLQRYCGGDDVGKLVFVMKPDKEYSVKEQVKEQELTKRLASEVVDHEGLRRMNEELKDLQEENADNKSLLPCLQLSEVSPKIIPSPYTVTDDGKVYRRTSSNTNGLGYFHIKISLLGLSDEDIKLLPLLTGAISELGVEGKPIELHDIQVKATCAGLGLATVVDKVGNISLVISSHSLNEKIPEMFTLLQENLTKTNWSDLERLKTVLLSSHSSMTNSIASAGHSFASLQAASGLNTHRQRKELMSGLSQVRFLEELMSTDLEGLSKQLEELASKVLNANDSSMVVISDGDTSESALLAGTNNLLSSFTNNTLNPIADISRPISISNTAIVMPFGTNFVASVIPTDPDNIRQSANLAILARLLRPAYLHREIREKNGAYGGGASFSPLDGLFSYYSYRDPNPLRTIEIINSVHGWLSKAEIGEQEVLEAKLAVFSEVDAPVDLPAQGMSLFLYGKSDVDRQVYRDALFKVDLTSMRQCADDCLGSRGITVTLIEDKPELREAFKNLSFTIQE